MEEIKSYKMRKSEVNLSIVGGGSLGLLTLVLFLSTGMINFATLFGVSVLFLVIGLINNNRKVVKIYESHMEIKLAPASKLHLIKYENLLRIENHKRRKKLYYNDHGKERKLLFLKQISVEDMEELMAFVRGKIEQNTDVVELANKKM